MLHNVSDGDLAQLVERRFRIAEVRGSTPLVSTHVAVMNAAGEVHRLVNQVSALGTSLRCVSRLRERSGRQYVVPPRKAAGVQILPHIFPPGCVAQSGEHLSVEQEVAGS